MNAMATVESRVRSEMNRVLSAIVERRERLVLVDSPPGAGKTWLCERLIALAIGECGMRVCYVTPKVEQGADMARRLLAAHARFGLDVLTGQGRAAPPDLQGRLLWTQDASAVAAPGRLVITTPQKLTVSRDDFVNAPFDLLLIDEVYQVAAKDLLPMADLAACIAGVGDPGQLSPTETVDTAEFEGDGARMHWSAPREVLRVRPDTPVYRLPASRRLVSDTVRIVQPAFYPSLPFVSAAADADRCVEFEARGVRNGIDRALDLLAAGCSIVGVMVPGDPPAADERDPQVERVVVRLVRRLQERGARWKGRNRLSAEHVGVVDTRVLSGNAMRASLQAGGLASVRVATPELWQGREAPIVIAKHPLNVGNAAPGSFDLDPGRLCVMLSRHQLGCFVVGRESIGHRIAAYMHDSRPTPIGAVDRTWLGHRAHAAVWHALARQQRLVTVTD